MASQYGQTAFLYHVALRWAADVDETDVDGRTPLHWAAYKGFANTVRLLLVLDARWSLPDSEVALSITTILIYLCHLPFVDSLSYFVILRVRRSQ